MKDLKSVRKLTALAIFVALIIIFSQLLCITFSDKKFSFTFLVNAAMCSVFSMPACIVATIVADLLGNTIFPSGFGFYPLFILPKVVTVIIYCFFFYRKEVGWKNSLLAAVISYVIANLFITCWVVANMNHTPFWPMFITRIPSSAFNLTLNAVLMPVLLPRIVSVVRRELYKMGAIESSQVK